MKRFTTILAAATALPLALGARAAHERRGQNIGDMQRTSKMMPVPPNPKPPAPMTRSEVKNIDRQAGKVTIKHGRLKNLDMPAMTRVFRTNDPAMLDRMKKDKIRFVAENLNGMSTVTQFEAIK